MTWRIAVRGYLGAHAEALPEDGLTEFLEAPDRWMARGNALKDDPASWVVRCRFGVLDVVIKRFRYPDAVRAVRRALRPSRARACWQGSLLLQQEGFNVPEPLAWIEARRGPVRTASWFIAAHVEGGPTDPAQARPVVQRLQDRAIAHGDLKITNFLTDPLGEVYLLDLHAVRRVAVGSRALRRDAARFARNEELPGS